MPQVAGNPETRFPRPKTQGLRKIQRGKIRRGHSSFQAGRVCVLACTRTPIRSGSEVRYATTHALGAKRNAPTLTLPVGTRERGPEGSNFASSKTGISFQKRQGVMQNGKKNPKIGNLYIIWLRSYPAGGCARCDSSASTMDVGRFLNARWGASTHTVQLIQYRHYPQRIAIFVRCSYI